MSIFRFIQGCFSNDLLIEIREKRLKVSSFSNSEIFDEIPLIAVERNEDKTIVLAIGSKASSAIGPNIEVVNPFSHPRSMVSNFTYAQKIMQHAIRCLHTTKVIAPAPRVIIHQLEKTEGGLTEIEDRVLRELALGAGAREVIVYSGSTINTKAENYDAVKTRSRAT